MFEETFLSRARYDYGILDIQTEGFTPDRGPVDRSQKIIPGSTRAMISRSPLTITDQSSSYYMALDRLSEQKYAVSKMYAEWLGKNMKQILALVDSEDKRRTLLRHMGNIDNAARYDNEIYSETFYDTRGRTYHLSGETLSLQCAQISRWAMSSPETYKVTDEGRRYMRKVFEHEGWPTTIGEAKEVLAKPTLDFAAVRAAITIIEIVETGKTNYLIEQDASCSGFQMMGLIENDVALLKATNVIAGDTRGDLYIETAYAGDVVDLFKGDVRAARKFCKPVVMLTGYGSGARGLAIRIWIDNDGACEYLEDEFGDPEFEVSESETITIMDRTFTFQQLTDYCKNLQTLLMERFPSIKRLRDACVSYYSHQMRESNHSLLQWFAPDGFDCRRYITEDEQIKKSVKAAGAMPNIVHSVDACIIRYVLNTFTGDVVGVVHDAFFTTINDAIKLRDVVKNAYRYLRGREVANLRIKFNGEITGPCIGV